MMILLCLFLGWVGLRLAVGHLSPRPEHLGHSGGRLAECPASPNCVSSQAADPAWQVAPLTFTGDAADARRRLRTALAADSRTRILRDDGPYLHAEARTAVFGFVDDVEFLFDEARSVIHVRSASRLGHSDLGTNRRRVEALRRRFAAVP